MSTSTNYMESKIVLDFEDPNIYHDRILVVGERKFYVVLEILSMWSEHFRGLFNGNFNEADKKEIELKELDAEVFEIFLRTIYEHNLPATKVTDIISLIEISYRFLAPIVLAKCKEFIDKNLKNIDEIMLNLLETACVYGIEGLKTKLTIHLKNESIMSKFDIVNILEVVKEHKLDDLKSFVILFMKDRITVENIIDYLEYCDQFGLPELKTNISEAAKCCTCDTIPTRLIIELTKCAFKHDLKTLKQTIRYNIYYMVEEKHKLCYVRAKNDTEVTSVLSVNWFIRDNKEEIVALPAEISQFILFSSCQINL